VTGVASRAARGAALAGLAFASLALAAFAPAACAAADAAWAALQSGGHVLIVRHAQTEPGIGDPPGFRRDDCATQRNLSDAGRAQSQAMGERIAAAGVRVDVVLSSGWCRSLDTARIAFGRATHFPALDSFFDDRSGEARQSAAVRERVRAWQGPGTLALVTHQVNITALTGEVPAMGEAVVLAPGGAAGFSVVGRIRF
jgi:broad specificity phosphatase PhoE